MPIAATSAVPSRHQAHVAHLQRLDARADALMQRFFGPRTPVQRDYFERRGTQGTPVSVWAGDAARTHSLRAQAIKMIREDRFTTAAQRTFITARLGKDALAGLV